MLEIALSNQLLVKTLVSVGAILLTRGLVKYLFAKRRERVRNSYPRDVVIVHQMPRNKKLPTASPFALKLETWCVFFFSKTNSQLLLLCFFKSNFNFLTLIKAPHDRHQISGNLAIENQSLFR
jgi:hypothetical protein